MIRKKWAPVFAKKAVPGPRRTIGFGTGDALRPDRVPALAKKAQNCRVFDEAHLGTILDAMHCQPYDTRAAEFGLLHVEKEHPMRNRILAIAALAAAIGVPMAAQAQTEITTGAVRGGTVIVNDDLEGITVDRRPAFREYVIRERVPDYSVPERVIVGGVLPETGVTYYDVPQSFGVMPYRYTVVNGQTVLVEPRSRRIVQVVE